MPSSIVDSDRSDPSNKANCIFCRVSPSNGFDIVWQDENFLAFRDRKPACSHHIQLVPKRHINNVKELQSSDVELLKSMFIIGHRILDSLEVDPSLRKMGFHIPPFRSVNHLHLHVQAIPYKSFVKSLKYRIVPGSRHHHKGFSWFVEIGQAILILEQDGNIGTLPC
ncbi:HIT-like protein [Dendrothele bispora CBS 962.96]|uniref:HIT-like protein n=1 Tax=Dendrothele bispora (strain CBS 962.96) TaxID=1314807 RepID=A0A4S8MYL6_DENBC|nr:HIT-like protein [Dendrothele bispora CBS 962.96]